MNDEFIFITLTGVARAVIFSADDIDLVKHRFYERDVVPEPSLAAALSPPKWTPPTGAPAQEVRL